MIKSWRLSYNDEWMNFMDEEDREQFYTEKYALMAPYLMGIIEKLRKQLWPEEWPDVPDGD